MKLYKKATCRQLLNSSWESQAYQQFEEILTDKGKPFPCTLGIAGFNADQLRYHFVEHVPASAEAAVSTAATLQSYLPIARDCGKNIHKLDSRVWPQNISKDPDSHQWEFSFGGEPIFVVCNTPSHKNRLSRYGEYFTVTFQPRWVFNGVIGTDAPVIPPKKSIM